MRPEACPTPTVLQWPEAPHLHPWVALLWNILRKETSRLQLEKLRPTSLGLQMGEICHLGQPRASGNPICYLSGGREEEDKRR